MLDYRRHNTFMQRPLPITTPIVLELHARVEDEPAERDPDASLIPLTIKPGFKLYSYVDPSVAVGRPASPPATNGTI